MDEDIDGIPMEDDDSDNAKMRDDDKKLSMPAGFVPSRWETVDPDQVIKILNLILVIGGFYLVLSFLISWNFQKYMINEKILFWCRSRRKQ